MPERRGLVAVSAVGRVAAVAVPDPVRPVRVALQEDVLEDVLVGGSLAVVIIVDGVQGIAGGEEGLEWRRFNSLVKPAEDLVILCFEITFMFETKSVRAS